MSKSIALLVAVLCYSGVVRAQESDEQRASVITGLAEHRSTQPPQPLSMKALAYFSTSGHKVWRDYPIDQLTQGSSGNDTAIRIHGLGERFTSPFSTTYLDSIVVLMALPHYVDIPNNDIFVQVFGSTKIATGGLYADLGHEYFTQGYHPLAKDTNLGMYLVTKVPHVFVDTAFFVTVRTRDTSREHILLGIAVDSEAYDELKPFDENRDRGREIGDFYQSYMAGVQYAGQPGVYWYSNPIFVAFVSDTKSNVAAISSNGIQVFMPAPNPAQASTSVRYVLPTPSQVSLDLYESSGKLISHHVDGMQPIGEHTLQIGTLSLASGAYQYVLTAGRAVFHGRFTVER